MERQCTFNVTSKNGDRTNTKIIVMPSAYENEVNRPFILLNIDGNKYEVELEDLEEACRVMRA